MENLNSLKSSSKIKINSNSKKIKTQIIPINKKSFLPISKMNNKNKIHISNSNYETTIKPILNTTAKLPLLMTGLSSSSSTGRRCDNLSRLSSASLIASTYSDIKG